MTLEEVQAYIKKENYRFTTEFVEIEFPAGVTDKMTKKPFKLMRNEGFVAQLYRESHGAVRISVNRSEVIALNAQGGPIWGADISWEELQSIKSKLGYGHRDAVEVYPKDEDVVNVANMRHLFVLPADQDLPFIWRKKR